MARVDVLIPAFERPAALAGVVVRMLRAVNAPRGIRARKNALRRNDVHAWYQCGLS